MILSIRQSPVPKYFQLSNILKDKIRNHVFPVGSFIPGEMKLCAQYQLSRPTVRQALLMLEKEGLIVRKRRMGTSVVSVPRQDKSRIDLQDTVSAEITDKADNHAHPFAYTSFPSSSQKLTLRLVLFENMPLQRMTWNRIVNKFNETYPDLCLEIEWLPAEVDTLNLYKKYLYERRPDLAIFSYPFAQSLAQEGLLAPLPEDLVRLLQSDQYCSCIVGANDYDLLARVAPIHFSPWGVLWNEDLIGGRAEDGISRHLTQSKLIQWMIRVGEGLPAQCSLLANAWELPRARGIPIRSLTKEKLSQYFDASFEAMEQLRRLKDKFLWEEPYPLWSHNLFFEEKAAFYVGSLSHVFRRLPAARFRLNGAFLLPEQDCFLQTGWSCIGAPYADTLSPYVEEVLRFLVSEPAQNEISAAPFNAAFRYESNRNLFRYLRGSNDEDLKNAIRNLYLFDVLPFDIHCLLDKVLRSLYQDVMEGTRTVGEAVGMALEKAQERSRHNIV